MTDTTVITNAELVAAVVLMVLIVMIVLRM
jgi:hypothetical protein